MKQRPAVRDSIRRPAASIAAATFVVLALACSDTPTAPTNSLTPSDYTGGVEAVSPGERVVLLVEPDGPTTDAHLMATARISGIGSLQELEDTIRGGSSVRAHAHFMGDYHYTDGADATSLDVLEVRPPVRWQWRTPVSPRLSWHGWLSMGNTKPYFWVTPWTVFAPDSDYKSIEGLKTLAAACAEIDANQTIPNWVGFWATSIRVKLSEPVQACDAEGSPAP